MSLIVTLEGRTSTLSIDFLTPLQLDPDSDYGLALLGFHSYNSIPNIDKGSKFYLQDKTKAGKIIDIPEGSYDIVDIETFIRKELGISSAKDVDDIFSLKPNNNTRKCEISSQRFVIDFHPKDSIAQVLGFSNRLLNAQQVHTFDLPVSITKVRTIHIDSNVTAGALYNDRPSHTIYEFAVAVDPGYAIDETPRNLIYLPIVSRRELPNITLQILDQDNRQVNFRGEEIIIRLELKKLARWY